MRANEFTNFNYKSEPYEGWNGDGIVIRAYDGKDEVGHVIFEPTEDDVSQWYALDVEVEEPYQRKGIATKMYDIAKKVAKQQGVIIVKSHAQTDAGRGLWQDKKVWEQQNTNESKTVEYEGLTLKISKNGHQLMVNALDDWGNKVLGHVKFNIGDGKELDPQDLAVDDKYQGQGIAKVMYDYVKSLGYTIVRSYDQTDAGAGFWNKHRGEDVRIWEAFDNPYKGKWEKSDYGDVDLNTKLPDGTNLSIMFNNQQGDEGEEVVQVEFYRNNSQEVTGEGDAQRIFATVLDAIQKYIKKYKPQRLSFSASKATDPTIYYEPDQPQPNPESRAKLYDRLVQRYSKALGYRAFRADNGDIVIYELSRIKQGMAEGEGGLGQVAGIGINGKQFNFSIKDLIAKAQNYPVKKLNPQLFVKQLADRHEDPKQTAARAQSADLQYPIIVVQDGNTLMIADGTHRAQKAIMNKLPAINAHVIPVKDMAEFSKQGVVESVNDYLWHGSRYRNEVLVPRQANDTGGKEESNKNAIYATPSAKVAIAMGLTTPGSDTGMFPNDPQMVLFKGGIRKGEMVYLHKVPKDLFIKHNSREWYSKPDVKEITPIEVVTVPVDKWLSLIRTATPKDLELQKKNMKKQGVAEGLDDNRVSFKVQKGKNKFATTLSVGGDPVGVYQYDADTGRSIAEIYPEFKGKGLGKLLVLHAIYTAANLGLDFQEDESRTSEYDNVLDSLSSNGYIVDDDGYWYVTGQGEQYLQQSLKQDVAEEDEKKEDPIVNAVIDFYQHVGKIHKDPIDDYVSTAKEMLGHVDDPTLKSKLLDIFRQAKQNPYVQGGVVTTIGALLAGGVLSSAQKMGLSPSQTNLALQAILNTVIPTVVSRINGKSWSDTIKYTLASAGIGTGIAGMMDEARGLSPTKPYDDLMANMGYFMSLNTVKIQQDAVDSNAQQELANMQQQFRKPILNGMSFFDVNRDIKMSKNPKVAPILLKYVYDMLGYIEPRIKKYIKPEQQGKYLDRLDQIKNDYRGAVQQVS